uniref:F-box only protein 28 isoform X1 n=1 Tax=Petromyzon marinus TaxID=7757 RepID=A0AAJ7TKW4_PETMA|nr:F-box only protein 28 isoform X1 [Petromyzon marinus]
MEAESELLSLPSVAMDAVLAFCSYDEISGLRLVCKKMNVICQRVLNQGFLRVERYHAQCQKQVKSQLPRRESERRSHPLARHADILAAVETRLSLLTMTFMKYVDMNLCCFIPGRVIDEIYRVLRYVNGTRTPQRAHEVLQELRDISSMAMEYFDEKIVPGLKKKIGGDMSTRFLSATSVPGPSGALATVQLFSKQSCAKQELNKMQTQLKANSTGLGGLRKELNDLRGKLGELQRQVQEQEQKLLEQSQVMVEQSTRLLEQERKLGQTEAKLTEQHSVQLALPPPPALQPSKGGGGAPSTSAAADAGDVALAAGVGGRAAGHSAHRRGGRGRGRGAGRGGGGGGAGGVDRGDGSQPAPPAADRSRSRPGAVAAQGGSAGGGGGRGGSSGSHRKRCLAREAASSSATPASASIGGDGGCGAANCAAATTTVPVAAAAGSASPSASGQALPKRRKMLHGDEEAVGGAARRTTRKAHGATAAVDSNSSKRQRAKK